MHVRDITALVWDAPWTRRLHPKPWARPSAGCPARWNPFPQNSCLMSNTCMSHRWPYLSRY